MTRRSYGRAPWRPSKSKTEDAIDSLQHAHTSLVAALEWLDRDEEGGYMETALDQAHLSFRFLEELLEKHGRVEKREEPEDV